MIDTADITDGVVSRFWAKVVKSGPTECWEWIAYRRSSGYGELRVGPRKGGRAQLASRVAFCIANGIQLSAIAGRLVLHSCDNPPCVNPAHLRLGSQADNIADMLARDRRSKSVHYPRGSRHWMAKLTEAQAREIRECGGNQYEVAARFGVTQSTVHLIRKGKIWRHA